MDQQNANDAVYLLASSRCCEWVPFTVRSTRFMNKYAQPSIKCNNVERRMIQQIFRTELFWITQRSFIPPFSKVLQSPCCIFCRIVRYNRLTQVRQVSDTDSPNRGRLFKDKHSFLFFGWILCIRRCVFLVHSTIRLAQD